MIPDIEQIVGDTLRSDPAITALDARVAGELPKSFTRPWIRVTQLDALNASGSSDVEHLISYMIQCDCYAGSDQFDAQSKASDLARTARDVLFGMKRSTDAVITNISFKSHARVPDLAFEPARERVILTVEIHCHV